MFGAFFSGDFFLGKSTWGPLAPKRDNPDIDGEFIPTVKQTVASFGTETIEEGNYIPARNETGDIIRIK